MAQDRPLVPLLVKNDAVGDASPYPRQSLVFCSCPVPGGAQGQPDTALALHMKVISYQKPPAPECFTSAIIALLNIRRKHKPVPMYGSKILLDLFVCHRFLFSLSCSSSDLVLWFWRRGLINPWCSSPLFPSGPLLNISDDFKQNILSHVLAIYTINLQVFFLYLSARFPFCQDLCY